MKYSLLAFFLMNFLFIDAKANIIKTKSFKIVIGKYTDIKSAQNSAYKFPDTNAHVIKSQKGYISLIDNIYSKDEALNLLKRVKKVYKKAKLKSYYLHIEGVDYEHQSSKSTPIKKKTEVIKATKTTQKSLKRSHKKRKNIKTPTKPKISNKPKITKDSNIVTAINKSDFKQVASTHKTSKAKANERSTIKNKIDSQKSRKKGLTLKEAITLSLKNSYKIRSSKEKVIQAKHKLREKLAAYYPKVDLYANAGGSYLKPYKKSEVKFLKSDESLIITENIYAGGKHYNEIKQAKEDLKAALAKYRDKVEEESSKIIDAYLSLLFQKKAIKLTKENMISLERILNIVTIKEKNGAATKGDLNYIKSQVENAKSSLVDVESKYKNALSYYEYFVGELNESKMPVEKEFKITLKDIDEVLKKSYQNNAKIVAARAKLEAQKYALKAQKSKFLPKLDLTITGKDKQSGYLGEPQEDRATAMLQLRYNLYNGGKDEAQRLGIKSKIRELQYSLVDIKRGLKHNTEQLYESVNSNKERLSHTLDELNSNKKVVDSYWSAFKYGNQDLQALLLAQRALNKSELDALKQKQTYTQSYFKLLQQTGELMEYLGIDSF